MKRVVIIVLMALVATSCDKPNKDNGDVTSRWISRIVEYRPSPGQFINTATGDQSAAENIVGGKGSVSLGGFGGYIVFAFDGAVTNGDGTDFVVFGNSFEGSSEPGAVAVSVDVNGNGVADDAWWELRGSVWDEATKNYRIEYHKPAVTDVATDVEWTDNLGASGVMSVNEFHKQSYWPLFLDGQTLVFEGNLVKQAPELVGETWVTHALKWGYADNFSMDYVDAVGGDLNTANSNKFDISNAVDGSGVSVTLSKIDFVKVYTCVREQAGWIGELSTDVCGAIAIH